MKKKGFTLIELLVVIAIIGILSSIVLVSLRGATDKAKDARIVSDMAQMRTQALLYEQANGTYVDFDCTVEDVETLCVDIVDQGPYTETSSITFTPSENDYAVFVQLNTKHGGDPDYYCIDATGRAGYFAASTTPDGATTCAAIGTLRR